MTSVPFWANVIGSLGGSWLAFTFTLYFPTYLREVHGLPSFLVSSIPLPESLSLGLLVWFHVRSVSPGWRALEHTVLLGDDIRHCVCDVRGLSVEAEAHVGDCSEKDGNFLR